MAELVRERFRPRAVGGLAVVAALVAAISACGEGTRVPVDKSPDELNFSEESAADAGQYGVRDFVLPDSTTGETTSTEPTSTEPAPTGGYSGYETVQDESGSISFEAPVEWSDVSSGSIGPFQASAVASPDIDGLMSGWDVPGGFIGVSKSLGAEIASADLPELALPTAFASVSPRAATSEDCDGYKTFLVGSSSSDNVFNDTLGDLMDVGLVDIYSNCGGNGTAFIDAAGYSGSVKTFLYLQLTLTSDADFEAVAQLLTTLQVDYAKVPNPSSAQLEPGLILP